MTFKEWLKSLETKREHTPAEDLADSIGLMLICALVCFMIFM